MLDTPLAGSGQVALLAATLATFLTTVATLLYQFVREGRRHRWEVEAAERRLWDAAKAEKKAAEIAAKVEESEASLNAKLAENTEISRAAFEEANHLNEKIKAQGLAFDRLLETSLVASAAAEAQGAVSLSEIQATAEDVQHKVTDIHQKVVEDA